MKRKIIGLMALLSACSPQIPKSEIEISGPVIRIEEISQRDSAEEIFKSKYCKKIELESGFYAIEFRKASRKFYYNV